MPISLNRLGRSFNAGGGLCAVRYSTDGAELLEVLDDVSGLAVRWSLPFGFQRLEFSIKTSSRLDAFQRYQNHQGDRIAILDHFVDTPIVDGYCYEVVPDGQSVTYIVGNKRHTDEFEQDNPTPTDQTDVYIKSVLTGHVPSVNSDQSNIESTGLVIGEAFAVDDITGTLPKDIVDFLVSLGTSANEALGYYLVNQPLLGGLPREPKAYLVARDSTNTSLFSWQVDILDLAQYGFSRHIWDLANDVTVYYTLTTTLSVNAASGATALTVTSISGFADNDEIAITLDSDTVHRTTINGVPAGSTINIDDALTNAAASGNLIEKLTPTATSTATDTTSQAAFWKREFRSVQTQLNQTQAEAFRDLTLGLFKDPVQQTSFVIGSGKVQDQFGAVYPIWRLLINPDKIRVNDLFPISGIEDLTGNSSSVFRIIALDYNHDQRSMTVTPDNVNGSARLDVILQQAGIDIGQIIDKPVLPKVGAAGVRKSNN